MLNAVQPVAIPAASCKPDSEAEELDRDKGDERSADAWHDIAEAICCNAAS
ncbi:MAG: hypothetical protein ACM3JG_11965 [Thiohalocapsa sp.]